jgi:hypothetical protein
MFVFFLLTLLLLLQTFIRNIDLLISFGKGLFTLFILHWSVCIYIVPYTLQFSVDWLFLLSLLYKYSSIAI